MIGVAWTMVSGLFGSMWKYRLPLLIFAACALVFGLWRHSMILTAEVQKLTERTTQQDVVITEYEQAQHELDGKVAYEKAHSKVAAASAAAVAEGRRSGNGDMAPVLRAEYERVHALAAARQQDRSR